MVSSATGKRLRSAGESGVFEGVKKEATVLILKSLSVQRKETLKDILSLGT